jgi:hypothetical protein|tara:strand:+ start:3865 stop:4194 length:330 start_codon:yes stop_codon:yes gene_type:complete
MIYRTLLFSLVITSCLAEKEEIHNIISTHEFTNLVKEIHLIEAKYESTKFNRELEAMAILQNDYDVTFESFGIKYDDFKNSLKYYAINNDQLEVIYSNALDELKKEKLE